MHLSILHSAWPPPKTAASARTATVTLPWSALAAHVAPDDLSAVALRAALATAGTGLECVELPPLAALADDDFERETDDTYMRLQIVERIGAPIAVIASGHEGSAGFDMLADALTRLAALAERMDVRFAVRNVCGSAVETPDALHALLRRVNSPDLGVCLDALEFAQALVNPADAVLSFSGRLAAVCLPAQPVPNLRVTESNIRATLAELAEEAFAGPIIVEAREGAEFTARFGDLLSTDA